MIYSESVPPSLTKHALEVITKAIAEACPQDPHIHDIAARAVLGIMNEMSWIEREDDMYTDADSGEPARFRRISAVFGFQAGHMRWDQS